MEGRINTVSIIGVSPLRLQVSYSIVGTPGTVSLLCYDLRGTTPKLIGSVNSGSVTSTELTTNISLPSESFEVNLVLYAHPSPGQNIKNYDKTWEVLDSVITTLNPTGEVTPPPEGYEPPSPVPPVPTINRMLYLLVGAGILIPVFLYFRGKKK